MIGLTEVISQQQQQQQHQQQQDVHPRKKARTASIPGSGGFTGNKFSKDSPYFLEYDQEETARLLEQHEVIKAVVGGNFDAPVHESLRQGIKVLDSGCGPGHWTIDMCNQYPRSAIYAMDIPPDYASLEKAAKHQNCKFVCADILKPPLPFPDNHFDFIHQQLLVYGIKAQSWPGMLRELIRVLKPGGWIELNEIPVNDYFNLGPKLAAINKCMKQGTIERGFRISISRELEKYLMEAGATNIEVKPVAIPLQHGGQIGEHWCHNIIFGLFRRSFRPMIEKVFPEMKDDETFNKYLAEVANECKELETSSLFFRVYAQKPSSAVEDSTNDG